MEPCQFCGQFAPVDAGGFCTNCRNYRGVATSPVSSPAYPTSGPAYPTSAPSYGGQVSAPPYGPTSGPPVTGAPYSASGGYPAQPYSAPPAYQQPTQYQQPAPYQPMPAGPPPTKQRSGYVIPIIALCSVMALLVIGIVVVVLVKHGSKSTGGGGGTTTASGLDKCLVGTWKVSSYETTIPFDNVGSVDFTASSLQEVFTINADGTATDNYGTQDSPTVLIGTSADHDYKINIYGTVTYTIKSANDVLSFSQATADGELELFTDGASSGTIDLKISNDPTPYTCSSTTLTQTTEDFTATATKSG